MVTEYSVVLFCVLKLVTRKSGRFGCCTELLWINVLSLARFFPHSLHLKAQAIVSHCHHNVTYGY